MPAYWSFPQINIKYMALNLNVKHMTFLGLLSLLVVANSFIMWVGLILLLLRVITKEENISVSLNQQPVFYDISAHLLLIKPTTSCLPVNQLKISKEFLLTNKCATVTKNQINERCKYCFANLLFNSRK